MGEVYRATDTRLKRDVAIKVLPEDVTRDRERLARFEREAQVLASLSHPNIGAIFGVEDSGGTRCLILELIEGDTLAEVIARGPLPIDRALHVALQIAEGLEAAHDKGIVHRDLKPANVKVTPDGTVKVLDFGLAKAHADETAQRSDLASLSPTMTAAATQMGVILGTAGYMSPEQAAGQPTDRRSDVWSFGVVMLEMLTGRKTFSGETVSHTLASILKEEPDWSRLPGDLSPRVRALLERCLSKKVRRRLQSIGEARILLEEYRDAPDSFAPTPPRPAAGTAAVTPLWKRALPWTATALLGLALASAPLWMRSQAAAPAPRHLSLAVPEGEFLFRGYGTSVVVSPDGSKILYVTDKQGRRKLYVHYLDQWKGTVLAEGQNTTTGPYNPFFSPDGQWVGFVTRSEMKKVPIRGGTPITLCAVDRSRGASWGDDGNIVFSSNPGSPLVRIPSSGGEPEPLTTLDEKANEATHRWPQVLPGAKAVLFTSQTGEGDFDGATIEVLELTTGQRKVVHKGGSDARYVPSGHIVYANQNTLFALPFDLATLEPTGSASPIVEEVAGARTEGGAHFSVADDGTLIYATGDTEESNTLVWTDRKGVATPLWDVRQDYGDVAVSPDGSRLVTVVDVEGNSDLWVRDLTREVPTRLTFGEGEDDSPVWSPDGQFIYFSSVHDGKTAIYRKAADGSGDEVQVLAKPNSTYPTSISPDGKMMIYMELISGQGDLLIHPLGGGDSQPFATGPKFEYDAQFSPDGRWIVYGSNESGPFEAYVRPASGDRGKWQISSGGGVYARWARDGRSIIYRSMDGGVVSVAVETTGGTFRAGRIETLFTGPYVLTADGNDHYDVTPDPDRFVMVMRRDETRETHEHIQIVLGWLDELKETFAPGGGSPR